MTFKDLHYGEKPLILANVWDVPSAQLAESLQFRAIGTSSSAISALFGFEDGEGMSFSLLESMVERISTCTSLSLSVDLESGYSRQPLQITDHIKRLSKLGVEGVNIEDSIVVNNKRTLLSSEQFAQILKEVRLILENEGVRMFVNVRTDTFLLGLSDPIEKTKRRIDLYQKAGADGIFTPCIEKAADIETVANHTDLPLNVMCMPKLPDFETLHELGVKRISMGNFLHDQMYRQLQMSTKTVLTEQSFLSIFKE